MATADTNQHPVADRLEEDAPPTETPGQERPSLGRLRVMERTQ